MKEPVFIIIKPDGIKKHLAGDVITRFMSTHLKLVAIKTLKVSKERAEEHYRDIKGQPFFKGVISYMMGDYHNQRQVVAMIFYGENAVKKCRKIAGATSPEDADPTSIRGAYGRITSKGLYENIVHVSSDKRQTKREIKLWFDPDEVTGNLYPTKSEVVHNTKVRGWL